MTRLFSVAFCALLLWGCANTHQVIRHDDNQHSRLMPFEVIYVSVPQDGAYGSDIYRGSGLTTTQIAVSSFQHQARVVRSGNEVQSFDQCIESAKKNEAKYLAYLSILHWEDRATEWSGKRDLVEVKLDMVDVESGKTLSSTSIKGRGKWMTFGGLHPQDLLPEAFEEYVSSLY